LTGKVFVSCGTSSDEERDAASKVAVLLESKFGLQPYVAIDVQSLGDIMNITKELRSSDYYLFIDFIRHSTFTHQELALAHHFGFDKNTIALQQEGAHLTGFLRYVQSNPTRFKTIEELTEKVEALVRAKGWSPKFSRNLVVSPQLTSSGLVVYGDHTGQATHVSWRVKIENRRPDVAAENAVCILDSIRHPSGVCLPCPDRGYLKWVGHHDYERTILSEASEEVDVFAIRPQSPGLFLLSTLDVPRQPIVTDNGPFELNYKVFARDFSVLEFTLSVWHAPAPVTWENRTRVGLKV
jgi:hypothetical protein